MVLCKNCMFGIEKFPIFDDEGNFVKFITICKLDDFTVDENDDSPCEGYLEPLDVNNAENDCDQA